MVKIFVRCYCVNSNKVKQINELIQNGSSSNTVFGEKHIIFVDTETTGLRWHQSNIPFIVVLANIHSDPVCLNLKNDFAIDTVNELRQFFLNKNILFVAHNAKFDAHMLMNLGIKFADDMMFWDTAAIHRLVNNRLMSYSLANITLVKSTAADEYIKKNKCYRLDRFGKKQPDYSLIPNEIIEPYAIQDVKAMRALYEYQAKYISKLDCEQVLKNEVAVTKILLKAERRGILVDDNYTKKAYAYYNKLSENAKRLFESMAGVPFVDSAKALDEVYAKYNTSLPKRAPTPKTKKINSDTSSKAISKIKLPISSLILEIRENEKKVNTYFKNFLDLRGDYTGALHCNFNQSGADTMRFSSSNPNLQNVSNEEDQSPEYLVRGCLIPRAGYKLVSIDFAAQEMRCLIDASGQTDLADKIIAGLDVHQATADMLGVSRKIGKTLGFALVYGTGNAALAESLKVSVEEASRLKNLYFSRLSEVKKLIYALVNQASNVGFIDTVYGNRLYIDPERTYIATNYFIQGSCAQHTKAALIAVDKILKKTNSHLLLQIHDEFVLEIREDELSILPEIQEAMEKAYPHRYLPMGTSVTIYRDRWGSDEI